MAKCRRCKMEMCDSGTKTCVTYQFVKFLDGTKMSPVPYSYPKKIDELFRCLGGVYYHDKHHGLPKTLFIQLFKEF